jgi:RNA polymerase sigma-70 factor (ECF subfamily)
VRNGKSHETDEIVYSRYLGERNENDLRILLERHREGLMLFLLGYVRNEEDAEELMMDSFAIVASGTSRFSGSSSFKTWLFAIGRNQAKMHLRKQKGFFVSLDESVGHDAHHDTPELLLLRDEEHKHLYDAIEELPGEYRQILILLYFEKLDRDDICIVMKKSKKQIYNLAERARKALREELEKRGYEYEKY